MGDLRGQSGDDGWHMLRGGFRTDSKLTPKDTLTVEGNLYTEREGELAVFLPAITSPGLTTIADEITSAGGYWRASGDRGADSARNERGSREVPGGGDGWLFDEANWAE